MTAIAPELEPLYAVVSATLDESGTLLEANRGFLRLVGREQPRPIGANVAEFFIQPDFATLRRAPPDAGGVVHHGLLTLGNFSGWTQSLRGWVRHDGTGLHLVAEYDIEDMERLNDAMLRLNADYADAQADLARTNMKIRELNSGLEQQVAERTRELREALLLADTGSRAKSAFIANMSHELRTPLNVILGHAYNVARQLGDPKLRDHVESIRNAGESLLEMINRILEMSRLESGDFQADSGDFKLASLLEASLGVWREGAAAKGIETTREIDPRLPAMLRGDAKRLEQILKTLVGNALKFSERGRITVRATLADTDPLAGKERMVRFEVEDQGIGIAPALQVGLFNVFDQVDSSLTRKHGGIGLGLALCRRLTQLLGGSISVSSTVGQGSVFVVTVPLALLENDARPALSGNAPAQQKQKPEQTGPERLDVQPRDLQSPSVVFGELDALLAQSDFDAIVFLEKHGAMLQEALGADYAKIVNEINKFYFVSARKTLRNTWREGRGAEATQ